jgi:hypothetical protein
MTGTYEIFDDSRIPQRIMQLREGEYEMERSVSFSGEPMVHRAKITFFDDAGGVKFDNIPASRCPRCGGDTLHLLRPLTSSIDGTIYFGSCEKLNKYGNGDSHMWVIAVPESNPAKYTRRDRYWPFMTDEFPQVGDHAERYWHKHFSEEQVRASNPQNFFIFSEDEDGLERATPMQSLNYPLKEEF